MKINGKLYQKNSAAFAMATLSLSQDSYTVISEDGTNHSAALSTVTISNRIGNIERKITLADGTLFATSDNDAIDAIARNLKGQSAFLHTLESKMSWVVVAVCVTVVFSFSFIRWGIPSISYAIANALPHSVNEVISQSTFEFLDDFMLTPSLLEDTRKTAITHRFDELVEAVTDENTDVKYTLYFRAWGDEDKGIEIPNALALPSGQIILTDKFVELADNQEQIDAVLLHEIGHVTNRHGLKMVIQGTMVATVVTLVAGDASGFADMGLGLGSLLLSSHYSRGHEAESDYFAFTNMLKLGMDPASFSKIMEKITVFMAQQTTTQDGTEESEPINENTENETSFLDYLSSHPKTAERIAQADRFSVCFRQGQTECKEASDKQEIIQE